CVVVLLNPRSNRQQHIINTSRKTLTALSFSPDGKHLVTGESGHLPAVRLWDVAERRQVAALQTHKYGVSCVAFSPDGEHVVSVGNQHDMTVSVWAWEKDVVVAANKVSSKVTGVSFSEDGSYFVTVGNRHIKFWYLDHCKTNKSSAPVPLLGRSALLGELRNSSVSAVACGRGSKSDSTFCITSSGLLCEFNHRRMLEKRVDLRTGVAHALCVSENLVFCGCSDGTVLVFSSTDLSLVCTLPRPHPTLPRPHPLGSVPSAPDQTSLPFSSAPDARRPDAVALTFDPGRGWLSCVFGDHSVFVWDLRDMSHAETVHSALYHSACVWDLQMFPDVPCPSGLSSGAFLSCSVDNTVRMWRVGESFQRPPWSRNLPSNVSVTESLCSDLLNVLHVDASAAASVETGSTLSVAADRAGEVQSAESRTGIRAICVSPDGKRLASGDRNGVLRVHDLSSLEQILQVDAHDAEILCLEYSKPDMGVSFLATASRDRLIHVLDAAGDHALVQTLDDHSSSVMALKFTATGDKVRLISCGADKSVYFRTAHKTEGGAVFRRSHHTVRKSTLSDMSVDPTCRYAAVCCQDRCIRLFDVSSGKQKKVFKGSLSNDGSLLKVEIDPSGLFVAASCSDKSISVFELRTGERVATVSGHSEVVTGLKFTSDCRRLVSVSGDSCVFVWRLAPELTLKMSERLRQLQEEPGLRRAESRRERYSAPPPGGVSSESDHEDNVTEGEQSVSSTDHSHGEDDTGASDEGPDWQRAKPRAEAPEPGKRPRRRWSHRMGPLELVVKSMLDLRQLETFGQKKKKKSEPGQRSVRGSASSLQETLLRDYAAEEWSSRGQRRAIASQDSRSPDSACSVGYDSRERSPDPLLEARRTGPGASISSRFLSSGRDGSDTGGVSFLLRAQKTRRSSGHLWRRSVPSAPSILETMAGLHKAHSVQNLASEPPVSPVSCRGRRHVPKPTQYLLLDQTNPPLLRSSPPSSSPVSRVSPLPWDSSPRIPLSYRCPTTSSIAKIARSSAAGEGWRPGSPPCSPNPEVDAPWPAPSPRGRSVPKTPSPLVPRRAPANHSPAHSAAQSPAHSVAMPSRIPLPRQHLGPRRSLGPELSRSRPCTSPGLDADAGPGNAKPALGGQSGRRKSDIWWLSKEPITVETCRLVVSELQECLRRSVRAYTTVLDSGTDLTEEQQQMKNLLCDAFVSMRTELHSLSPGDAQREAPESGRAPGDETLVLLERYARLLLRSVENKLDHEDLKCGEETHI
ncbi:mitogen-activated protein kinase-binding protein 1-like, partial [Eucyclogobius newberryi]|uniref:mitogen-activated protein kinase-binding protein 1-like n=1 Tax=Eucyclogobius newberryi TaxID=166745 RepID=UPI003B5A0436